MLLDLGIVLGDCDKHLCDSMADIVPHHILHEKHGYEHTYSRINKEEEVISLMVKPRRQAMMNKLNRKFQQNSCQSTAYTHKKGKDDHHIPFRKLAQKTPERRQNVLYEKSAAHVFRSEHANIVNSKDKAKK